MSTCPHRQSSFHRREQRASWCIPQARPAPGPIRARNRDGTRHVLRLELDRTARHPGHRLWRRRRSGRPRTGRTYRRYVTQAWPRTSLRAFAHTAKAHRPRAPHAAVSSVSPSHTPPAVTGSNLPPTRTPDAGPAADPPAPTAPVRRPAAPAPAPPAETSVTTTTSEIALPALPQLPAVQTPPIPIPSVLPSLPLAPAVPVLPPIGSVVLP